jgi:hypothetical protein
MKNALTLGVILLALGGLALLVNEYAAAILISFGVMIILLVISEPKNNY